jgi:hypothetical protein
MSLTPQEFVEDKLRKAARCFRGMAYVPWIPSLAFMAQADAIDGYLLNGTSCLTCEQLAVVIVALETPEDPPLVGTAAERKGWEQAVESTLVCLRADYVGKCGTG